MPEIEYKFEDGISTIAINRPEKKNSINLEVMNGIQLSLENALKDRAKVIIFKGNGGFFSAGADINQFFTMDEKTAYEFSLKGNNLMNQIERYPGVTISAISGGALGGGLELALSTDIRISSKTAKIGLPEVTLGIFPGWGGIKRISRILGNGIGKYLLISGKYVTGEEAYNIGLVNFLDDNPESYAMAMAQNFKGYSSEAIEKIKLLLLQDVYSEDLEAAYFGKIVVSPTAREYLQKFRKR